MSDEGGPIQESSVRKSSEERKELLARAIQNQLAQGKSRVETRGDYDAVLVKGKTVNIGVGAHILLSIVTAGLWLLVWVVLAIVDKEKKTMLTVDEYGITNISSLG